MSLSDALAQLDYPCRYPFKLFCHPQQQVIDAVAAAVLRQAPDWDAATLRTRHSRNGRYIAITATIEARSAGQIEAIYADLQQIDGILSSL